MNEQFIYFSFFSFPRLISSAPCKAVAPWAVFVHKKLVYFRVGDGGWGGGGGGGGREMG